MAVDSAIKRYSLISFMAPGVPPFSPPNGSDLATVAERRSYLGLYATGLLEISGAEYAFTVSGISTDFTVMDINTDFVVPAGRTGFTEEP